MIKTITAAFLAAAIAVPAMAQEQQVVTKTVVKKIDGQTGRALPGDASAEAAQVAACNARKFETSAELVKDGQTKVTKIKLCGKAGADDMAWVKTLESARTRLGSIPDLSTDSRSKIDGELAAEIARLHKAMGH